MTIDEHKTVTITALVEIAKLLGWTFEQKGTARVLLNLTHESASWKTSWYPHIMPDGLVWLPHWMPQVVRQQVEEMRNYNVNS